MTVNRVMWDSANNRSAMMQDDILNEHESVRRQTIDFLDRTEEAPTLHDLKVTPVPARHAESLWRLAPPKCTFRECSSAPTNPASAAHAGRSL